MTPLGFESAISASEQPQIYGLDCMAFGMGHFVQLLMQNLLAHLRKLKHLKESQLVLAFVLLDKLFVK